MAPSDSPRAKAPGARPVRHRHARAARVHHYCANGVSGCRARRAFTSGLTVRVHSNWINCRCFRSSQAEQRRRSREVVQRVGPGRLHETSAG